MDRSLLVNTTIVLAAALLCAVGFPLTASAQTGAAVRPVTDVDVNLVLAIDSSGSVEDDRFELQKRGFGAAFRDPRVLQAIRAGDYQAIAVFMVQWTGPAVQAVMVPWTLVTDEASAGVLAAAIDASPRRLMGGGTSISGAIDFSVKILSASPYNGTRRVIDISGDGANNIGRPAEQARDEAVSMGIRINGLPILTVEPDLDRYFRKNVIGGPGAFAIPAKTYDQFAEAILRKLITEISQNNRSSLAHRTAMMFKNGQRAKPLALPMAGGLR
jgi:hypothetical protein